MSELLSGWESSGENDFAGWLEQLNDDLSGFSKRWF
eukprot:SAG31_NODE_45569_length_258_cov_0.716981_1_plen_35_part_01